MTAQNQQGDHDLVEAELGMARALQRLSALRRAALSGHYDATAFDRAVAEYREAETILTNVRRARAEGHFGPLAANAGRVPAAAAAAAKVAAVAPAAPAAPEEPIQPAEPTPRLLFARWLVQTGRLTDWGPLDATA